ncbi:MAG: ATP-binding cassette domain-containing protein [Erysipelotrichaceae bacterium]|nr:ATP-binding cassette domain-containing protein [Erysipelotrichaceae bacterium]
MIELKNVSKKYKDGTHALHDVNMKINDGEFVYIMGPTGSGKSTLVKLLDGEEIPTKGKVIVSGIDVGRLRRSKVYLYRRKIGVVFQDYKLLPEKTVFENVAYALEILDTPRDKLRKRVREVLKLVDLSDKSNSKPDQLSGGQKQRTAIARALAKRPMIIIADEPTGNLDPQMTDEMVSLLEKINQEEKTTIIMVTHEISTVEKHPKRTIRLEAGHVVGDAFFVSPDEDKKVRKSGVPVVDLSADEDYVEEEKAVEEAETTSEETVPETEKTEDIAKEETVDTAEEIESVAEETAAEEPEVTVSDEMPVMEETPAEEPVLPETENRESPLEEPIQPKEENIVPEITSRLEEASSVNTETDAYNRLEQHINEALTAVRVLVDEDDLLIEDYTGTSAVLDEETIADHQKKETEERS